MASKCKKPITIDNGPLRGSYKPGDAPHPSDSLAESYPDYFDLVDDPGAQALKTLPPKPQEKKDGKKGGEIEDATK